MLFGASIRVVSGGTTPSPLTSPGTVPATHMFRLRPVIVPQSSDVPRRLLLGLDAGTAETVTAALWALDEATLPSATGGYPSATDLAARRFYRVLDATVITRGILSEATSLVPPGGWFYAQITATSLATVGTLGIACAG